MTTRPDFTFDRFVTTQATADARSACEAAVRGEGSGSLVLAGPPGVGKTHLLHAIANAAPSRYRVAYHSANDILARWAETLRYDTCDAFRKHYRGYDLLLVDDLHVLNGKVLTRSRFDDLLRDWTREGTTFVAAGSVSPARRLVRPAWTVGTRLVHIPLPTLKDAGRIAADLAARRGTPIKPRALRLLARDCGGDVRLIIGGLIEFEAAARPGFLSATA